MGIDVLGTLTIDGNVPSPRERAILAALVIRIGHAVSSDELATAYWGESPPSTWPKQIQAAIGRLRRLLGPEAIETGPAGYTLTVEPVDLDVAHFDGLLDAARTHRANGEPDRAVDALEHAIALRRGASYAELPLWEPATTESARLDEAIRSAEEDLVAAHLECGEHRTAVTDAERLVHEEPLREQRWILLATALYRSGRSADALRSLRTLRSRFDADLGIEPGREVAELEASILRQDRRLDPPEPRPRTRSECPYKGLAPYGIDDAADFFGRAGQVEAILARLDDAAFLAVTGASGCGKSSIMTAGVVPALGARHRACVVVTPSNVIALRDAVQRLPAAGILIVDQFEELFHDGHTDDLGDYCRLLVGLIAGGCAIVIVLRSDFIDECVAAPAIGPLVRDAVFVVAPMTTDDLRTAIEAPAVAAGLRLERGLVEVLLRDAADGQGALPLLSHALVETWLRREASVMTIDAYEATGGIGGAIAQTAERMYASLTPGQQRDCRTTFLRLFTRSADGRPVRRRIPLHSLGEVDERSAVIDALVDARLLTASADSITVAHESLATAWPRLASWLADDAESTALRAAVADAAASWEASGRLEEDLYRGARLHSAQEWSARGSPELTRIERRFLEVSGARETAEADAAVAQAARDRRQNRLLRGVLIGTAALLVASVVATGLAIGAADDATRQRTAASAGGLVSASLALRSSERDVAALLAVEAYRRWPDDPRIRAGLLSTFTAAPSFVATTVVAGTDRIAGALRPGTDEIVAVRADGTAAVYDLDTGAVVREIAIEAREAAFGRPPLVAVSADGSTAAIVRPVRRGSFSATYDDTDYSALSEFVAIHLDTGRPLAPPRVVSVGGGALAIDADGSTAAIGSAIDERLRIVDAATGLVASSPILAAAPAPADAPTASSTPRSAAALAFLADGRLVVGTAAPGLTVLNLDEDGSPSTIPIPALSANASLAVAEDGTILAGGDDGMVAVDPSGTVRWARATTPTGACAWLTVSTMIGRVYCASPSGRLDQVDLASGDLLGSELDPRLGTLSVSADGLDLIAVSATAPAFSRWRLDGGGAITRMIAPGSVLSDGYERSGNRIITSGSDVQGYAIVDSLSGEADARLGVHGKAPSWAGTGVFLSWVDDERAWSFLTAAGLDRIVGDEFPADAKNWWVGSSGNRLYVAVDNSDVWVIDSTSGERVAGPLDTGAPATAISSTPDESEMLVTSWFEGISSTRVVDTETGAVLSPVLTGPSVTVIAGTDEVIGADENRLVRYALDDLSETGSLAGDAGGAVDLAVSHDGRTLLVTGSDGSVSLYDLDVGARLGDPIAADPSPGGLPGALRDDGGELAVSRPDGVQLWNLDPGDQAKAACRVAGRDLTRSEWAAHLGDIAPYRSTCGFSAP